MIEVTFAFEGRPYLRKETYAPFTGTFHQAPVPAASGSPYTRPRGRVFVADQKPATPPRLHSEG